MSSARDLIAALFKDNADHNLILDQIIALPVKKDVKIAEGLISASSGSDLDVFSACSYILETSPSCEIKLRYLSFLATLLKTVQDPAFKRLIAERVTEFELFKRLIKILDDPEAEYDMINQVAKIVFYAGTRLNIIDLWCQNSRNVTNLISRLHKLDRKYLSLAANKILRHIYEWKHDMDSTVNDSIMDIQYCEWMSTCLRKHLADQDALYTLYYILNRMPMTNLAVIFQTNQLDQILESVIKYHSTETFNEDLELLALKISQFPSGGNFLSEKLERNSVLGLDRLKSQRYSNGNKGTNIFFLQNW